ncbi:hypothetical protein O0L34_g19096 [Tuta absoluta]|nr:hypothetical protein O0L34_g19096 [Tuta absoluta]
MTLDKFGHYLYDGGGGGENSGTGGGSKKHKYSPLQSAQDKFEINCNGKRLTHVAQGIHKGDATTKAQLEEIWNSSLGKIKDLRKKIELLEKRLNTPQPPAAAAGAPAAATKKKIALVPAAAAVTAAAVKKI